jgi:hypothetical protein
METILHFNEPLLRRAVFAFWRRSLGVGILVAISVGTSYLVFKVANGTPSWIDGALAAVIGMAIVIAVGGGGMHYRNSMRKFREMNAPQATFRADPSTFTLTSSIGTATFQWSTIKELWQFDEFWLLLFSQAQFSTLPTADLPAEMQTFIVEQVRAAGGKVR